MDGTIMHYLDGSLIADPQGWDDFEEELDRNLKERLIGVKYSTKLTFTGPGYEYLNNLYTSSGFCGVATYEARQQCGTTIITCARGVIILADCEFNETRCSVECDVVDDGFGARILNNKDIAISPLAAQTKNGEDLTPVTPIDLEVFRPSDGFVYADTRRVWDWYDAIRHAVLFITDNAVSATSDWYEALPDEERYCFLDGNELRVHGGDNPRLTYTFGELFNELAIKYDLWMAVTRDPQGNPVLRIEPQSTFFGGTGSLTQTDIQDLVRAIDTEQLYAKVSVGSDTFIKALQTGAFSLPFLVIRGFTKEEFYFAGVCNTNATLDLVNEWVIDTNVIEDVLINGNDEYDDDMFLIQYDRDTNNATQGFYLNPLNFPALYNEQLQNFAVLDRYDMPSDVGMFYSPIDASFRAERIAAVNTPVTVTTFGASTEAEFIVQYDNDYTAPNFDTTNNWGNGTIQGNPVSQANSRYTAPVQGYYIINSQVLWRIIENIPFDFSGLRYYKQVQLRATARHYNSANVELSNYTNVNTDVFAPGIYEVGVGGGFSMDVGDYVTINYQFDISEAVYIPGNPVVGPQPNPPFFVSGVTFSLIAGSYVETFFVTGGGFLSGGDVARVLTYKYERHIPLADWVTLTANPEDSVNIGGGPTADIVVHPKNAVRNVKTGATSWTMVKRPA